MAVNRLLTVKDYERHANGKQQTLDHPRRNGVKILALLAIALSLTSLGMDILGSAGMVMFIPEEGLQSHGMGCYPYIGLKAWDNLERCAKEHLQIVARARQAASIGSIVFWAKPAYDLFWDMEESKAQEWINAAQIGKTQPKTNSTSTYKHCTSDFKYEYATIQNPEADVAGLRVIIDKYTAQGYHIQSTYTMKSGATWYLVVLFEKVTVTETCT